MSYNRVNFGAFIPPLHKLGVNPHLALYRDMELIEHLDNLGMHEVWVGEHHSSGIETIGSPEVFLAAAGQRTKQIKLGTGVNSLPYHHPLLLADRIVLLDHLTRGRMMFGAGPGQLPMDASMLGVDVGDSRRQMDELLDVMMRLFAGETVSADIGIHKIRDARLQLLPFSEKIDLAVAAIGSPAGPKNAGRHGGGLLSLAAATPEGITKLAEHWKIVQFEAGQYGQTVSRRQWRMLGVVHLADSVAEAKKNVRYAMQETSDYFRHISHASAPPYEDLDRFIDESNESGAMVIGTPDMAVAQIKRLQEASGGFGTFLVQGDDFANFEAKKRSFTLLADEVLPHFQGMLDAPARSFADTTADYESAAIVKKATEETARDYERTRSEAVAQA